MQNTMKKVLLTGPTGAIGSAIVRKFLESGYQLTCLVRPDTKRMESIPKSELVKIIPCSIEEYESVNLKSEYDIFIHLAWDKTSGSSRDDTDIQLRNIQYTLDAVRLAHRSRCKVFIGAGSQAEYGIKDQPLSADLPVNPESGYGIAKYTAGKLSYLLCRQLGLRFNWLRILSVYGPGDGAHTLISYVINELQNGRSPDLTKCEQIWDYLYCDDAASAFLAIAENGINGKFYPLGSGKGRKLREYIEDIREIVNPEVLIKYGIKPYYPHQPMYLVADVSALEKDTGWSSEINFEDGISKIL